MSRRRSPNVPGGRPGRHEVTTTPAEEAEILLAAEREGATPARFLREAALAIARAEGDLGGVQTPSARKQQMSQLFALQSAIGDLAFQVKKVGVNVNQVAHAANLGEGVPVDEMRGFLVDEREHLDAARRLYDRVGELIDGLAGQGVAV